MRAAAVVLCLILLIISIHNSASGGNMRQLTKEEERVIIHRGTERPFTGEYLNNKASGIYSCRRCGADLYKSDSKFDSGCGWPAFDDEIAGAVSRKPDPDGRRVEIVCTACDAHLGHVFAGEGFTEKNIRHCVNSISLIFKDSEKPASKLEKAIFAAGCFWGVEHLMKKAPGVKSVVSGYTGGETENPDYQSVCTGKTGHLEAVLVEFDPAVITYEELVKLFFEIHDFSQTDGQGPDIGSQYLSAVFVVDESQRSVTEGVIQLLQKKGLSVATKILPSATFWPAEAYHQNYYSRTGKSPYCHIRRKIF